MSLKNIFPVLITLFSCGIGLGQEVELPKSMKIRVIHPGDDILNAKYKELLDYNVAELDSTSKWKYYMMKSTFHLFMKKDSVLEFLDEAKKIKPTSTCRILVELDDMYSGLVKEGRLKEDFTWYLWQIPNFSIQTLKDFCKNHYTAPQERSDREKSSLEILIESRDQEFRNADKVDWSKQDSMDLKNRELMDSLYTKHKSLDIFNRYELDQFSMVIHHSNDMEWNIKWFDIFFKSAMSNKDLKGGKLLGSAIERNFSPENRSKSDNPERDKIYIDYLKLKYPTFAEELNFNNY